jgi:chromosome segregation ATPase
VTTSRFLPLLNLVGCLLISGLIFAQWLKERSLHTRIKELNQQLVATREQHDAEVKRATALENDIAQLKEAIESTAQARTEMADAMAKLVAESQVHATTVATANQSNLEQVKIWENAIADRDAKIRELNSSLTATRERLNEAIAKLKEAGAR